MSLFDHYETSPDLEKSGIWKDYGDYRLKIARAGGRNVAYTKAFEKAIKPLRRAIATGNVSESQLHKVLAPVVANTILLGWEGVATREGELIPYSREKALELLLLLRDFFNEVRSQADDISNFQNDGTEAAAGN